MERAHYSAERLGLRSRQALAHAVEGVGDVRDAAQLSRRTPGVRDTSSPVSAKRMGEEDEILALAAGWARIYVSMTETGSAP
jgi:hypothetical protein